MASVFKQGSEFLFRLLIFCISILNVCSNWAPFSYGYKLLYSDVKYKGTTYILSTERSLLSCALNCGRVDDCLGFSFTSLNGQCQLFNTDISDPASFAPFTGTVLYVIEGCLSPLISDGIPISSQPIFRPGHTVGFACSSGYSISSTQEAECMEVGTWNIPPSVFCIRAGTPWCPENAWTDWFNRDNPAKNQDNEALDNLHAERPGQICPNPQEVDAQLTSGAPYTDGGDILILSASVGLICINAAQNDLICNNYEVRFCCPNWP